MTLLIAVDRDAAQIVAKSEKGDLDNLWNHANDFIRWAWVGPTDKLQKEFPIKELIPLYNNSAPQDLQRKSFDRKSAVINKILEVVVPTLVDVDAPKANPPTHLPDLDLPAVDVPPLTEPEVKTPEVPAKPKNEKPATRAQTAATRAQTAVTTPKTQTKGKPKGRVAKLVTPELGEVRASPSANKGLKAFDIAKELILEGLSTQEILDGLYAKLTTTRATAKDISLYRAKMRRMGLEVPKARSTKTA